MRFRYLKNWSLICWIFKVYFYKLVLFKLCNNNNQDSAQVGNAYNTDFYHIFPFYTSDESHMYTL